jgi:hypothetical protein
MQPRYWKKSKKQIVVFEDARISVQKLFFSDVFDPAGVENCTAGRQSLT